MHAPILILGEEPSVGLFDWGDKTVGYLTDLARSTPVISLLLQVLRDRLKFLSPITTLLRRSLWVAEAEAVVVVEVVVVWAVAVVGWVAVAAAVWAAAVVVEWVAAVAGAGVVVECSTPEG